MNIISPRHLSLLVLCSSLGLLTACPEEENNQPPKVVLNPEGPDKSYVVGDTVYVTVLAEDPDGDALTFSYTYRTKNDLTTVKNATFIEGGSNATFNWTPDSPDVTADGEPFELIFIVKDARGAEVQRKLNLSILPGNGQPRFESSANQIYRSCCDDPLSFEVKVRDDDTSMVTLSMANPLQGAEFEQTGPKKGRFTWTPTATQGNQRIHSTQFVVNDGQNPAVYQDATIVIYSASTNTNPVDPQADVCKGEMSVIHEPLQANRKAERELTISASLSAAAAERYDQAAISWTASRDPVKNPSASLFTTDMLKEGSNISGVIPNISAQDGADYVVYYKICLIDTDAAADDPNALLCAPSTDNLYYSFKAYASPNNMCNDPIPNDSFEKAQPVPLDDWQNFYLCSGFNDFHSINLQPGQKVALLASYSRDAALKMKLYDADQKEVTDQLKISNCTGLAQVELTAPAGEATTYYIEIEGDEIPYHIGSIELEKGMEVNCPDKANEPNQTPAKATVLSMGKTGSLAICPDGSDKDLYTIQNLKVGDTLEVTMNHMATSANLDLELYAPSQPGEEIGSVGKGVAYTFDIGKDDETLSYDIGECGTYTLLVFSNGSPAEYSLNTTVKPAACQDTDEFTCNHSLKDAKLFAWNKTYSLSACGGTSDWLKHKGNQSSILAELKITSGNIDDVKLEVYDFEGKKIKSATKGSNSLDLDVTFPDDDWYYFKVSTTSDVSYDLLVVQ